jgi:type II secretion system protein J
MKTRQTINARGIRAAERAVSSSGFTLLEVMISVGLLAAISMLMYQSIAVTMRARAEITRVEELNHSAQVALSHLKSDISMAYLSNHVNAEEPAAETMFDGKQDSILFTYLGHERRRRGSKESDQGVVEYSLSTFEGDQVLMRREKAIIDNDPEKGGTEDVVVTGVKEFKLSYWDEKAEDWTDDWRVEMKDAQKAGLAGALSPAIAPTKDHKFMKQAQEKMLQDYKLPPRVYIRLVLLDQAGNEFPFETQAPIHMRLPLNF